MAYNDSNSVASVTCASVSSTLLLYSMSGTEKLSSMFEYELELLSDDNSIDFSTLLGHPLTVSLELKSGKRYFNGIVTRVSQHGMLGRLYLYRATLHPTLWLLTRTTDCKVMKAATAVPDLVKSVLSDYGYTDVTTKLSASYQPREFCVQYRETDFNFINRLLESEGIYYYFEHSESSHTLVLCDHMSAHQPVDDYDVIGYFDSTTTAGERKEFIYEWHLNQEIRTGTYTLNDFDFTAPTADMSSNHEQPATHPHASMEIYDYPGGYNQAVGGSTYAEIRMQEQRAEFERIKAVGNVRALAAGSVFSLDLYPRDDQNANYLVVGTHVQIQNNGFTSDGIQNTGGEEFTCVYEVLNSTQYIFRAPRTSRIPVVQGLQTAIVVCEDGEEITTDEYGRVKVQFHWDRLGTNDENSSCWVRVSQIWAGKGWGAQFIPRKGQEVIVDFLEGNPDSSIIIGSVYNADQTLPLTLPANKTQSGIMTRSTLDGGTDNFNQLRFEDKKGSEEVFMQAEKDFNVKVKNDRTATVDKGNDTVTVSQGDRAIKVDQGNNTVDVSQGDRTINVGTGKISETAGTSITLKVGNNTIVMDTSSLTMTVGSNSITMDASGIAIKGMKVSIEGDTQSELKAPMTTVNGDGQLTLKGGMVMIN